MKSFKKIAFAAAIFSILLFIEGCSFLPGSAGPKLSIKTQKDKVVYNVEIADTFEQRKNGLMFRTSLSGKTGMLFIFDKPQILTFWMKNTLIPLDMIFLDENYKIVHIEKNLQPCKTADCPLFYSQKNALYTLEVNAGETDKFGIKEGDQVEVTK